MSPQQNTRLSILSVCIGAAFAAASAGAAAQGTTASSGAASGAMGAKPTMSSADKTFVQKATIGGLAEVEFGKLAQQKGSSDQVKQFGSRMVEDHSKANDELKQIVSSQGISAPTDLDAKHKSTMAKLDKLSGQQFDRAYMDDMVKDHKEDIALFRKESSSGKDSDLKSFAAKTLPTLEDHLKMAQSTDAAVKGGKTPSR
jgi:putative membrane protein